MNRHRSLCALLLILCASAARAAPSVKLCPTDMPPPEELAPVVLVGGASGGEYFEPQAEQMALCGWPEDRIFRYYRQAVGCVAEEAAILADYMDDVLATTGADRVDAMGYSFGGILLRWWLSFHDGVSHVDEVALWAVPNNGSPFTQETDPYCWMHEIHVGAPVMNCLNGLDPTCGNPYTVPAPFAVSNETPPEEGIPYYNFWSSADFLLPGSSTHLEGAISVRTPPLVHTDFHRSKDVRRLTMLAFLRRDVVEEPEGCATRTGRGGWTGAWIALTPAALLLRRRISAAWIDTPRRAAAD